MTDCPADNLGHVIDLFGLEHRPAFGCSHDRNSAWSAGCSERCAVYWVNRDIPLNGLSAANDFTIEQHGRFIFFTFTNDDDSTKICAPKCFAHCVYGCPING